ncbi:class I SAM-dependent methyltransferase [Phytoactinopolyspora mesophila]|uniref:Methyltransferase domain-containing protein n=1 Tax=Phytoactinopolyspora mesophila TaxID=2650750 RepID=A0A7K3LYK4_9ACTN|nr:class I SAM-dependent methyltransferase [Phytoactinopolyspora mesophila]NDL55762.1 methyltransferase domain-containing protein [Phytoactinopolyspora mesophila]
MAPDPYGDRELVALYDIDNPGGADHDYYRALADEIGARSILDLGCGTGLLTRSFVRPDRTVVGIDPSATMLDWARRQPGADAVRWILGTAAAIEPDASVDLAVCTGNAIMHVSSEELPATLRNIATALRPGGTFSFESRNPGFREWETWTRAATYGERDTDLGRLREWLDVTEVADGRVVFDAHNVLPDGEVRIYTSVLYFRGADEFADALREAGFDDVTISGGWRGEPVTTDSPVLVVRASTR